MASKTVGEIELEDDMEVTLDDEGEGDFELWFTSASLTTKMDLTEDDLLQLRDLFNKALGE